MIAIESEVRTGEAGQEQQVEDVGHVCVRRGEISVDAFSEGIPVPQAYFDKARDQSAKDYKNSQLGLSATVGDFIHQDHPNVPSNDWMSAEQFGKRSREDQLKPAVLAALKKLMIMQLISYYNDFPKPGVRFADVTSVLSSKLGFQYVCDTMVQTLVSKGWAGKLTKVVGFDARGFIFGAALARDLNLGFITLRKKGKLPGNLHSVAYKTEYSEEVLTIPAGSLSPNDLVLLVDDVIATGGTFKAGVDLIAMSKVDGAKVLGCLTLLKISPLEHVAKATLGDVEFVSVI